MKTLLILAYLAIPPAHKNPELCLQTGKKPFSGQTLQVDKTCPSGLRWTNEKK